MEPYPWGASMQYEYSPTTGVPNSIIVHHTGTKVTGVSGAQGTQMDAFGHFGYLDEIWDGEGYCQAMYCLSIRGGATTGTRIFIIRVGPAYRWMPRNTWKRK